MKLPSDKRPDKPSTPNKSSFTKPTADAQAKFVEEVLVIAIKHGLAATFRHDVRRMIAQKLSTLLKGGI